MRAAAEAELVGVCRALAIDPSYLLSVVERLSGIGSGPLGFRTAGTPEDAEVAAYISGQMREIGLQDVAVEPVPVDSWRLLEAAVAVPGGREWPASSFGGVPGVPGGVLTAPLVDAGTGERRRLDRLDVRGRIALVDWRSIAASPSAIGLELGLRGAVAMVLAPTADGPFFRSPGALGAFDGQWHAGAPPMVLVSAETAAELRASLPTELRLTLSVERQRDAQGWNVVGYLPGDEPGPIVVGAHHDGWFSAAFDNATGVAALLGIARALAGRRHRPRHTICFTTRTGEEYGREDSDHDWCTGAWQQVATTHPRWATDAPFHLCLEASGLAGLRAVVETPPELARWARRTARAAEREGWLPGGWRLGPPVTGTEQWPLLVSGIPGVAAYTWETSYARTDYHTQHDTAERLDAELLATLTRFYALLLLSADADPDGILEHGARSRELARHAARLGPQGEGLARAVRERTALGRADFTAVGTGLCAVDARGATCYPHTQAARDVAALEAAIDALAGGDRPAAVRSLGRVGDNAQARYLSRDAYARYAGRRSSAQARPGGRAGGGGTWAAASHLTASPDLWEELASLRGEAGAREPGRWLDRSLRGHLSTSQAELAQRLAAMTGSLGP